MAVSFCSGLGPVLLTIGLVGSLMADHDLAFFFGLNGNHHAVHLASGLLVLVASGLSERRARACCFVVGVFYSLLAIAGFVSSAWVSGLNLNHADDLLHTAIAMASLTVALLAGAEPKPVTRHLRVVGEHGYRGR